MGRTRARVGGEGGALTSTNSCMTLRGNREELGYPYRARYQRTAPCLLVGEQQLGKPMHAALPQHTSVVYTLGFQARRMYK